MDRGQEISTDAIDFGRAREISGKKLRSIADTRSGAQMAVTGAMALVSLAASFGLYAEGVVGGVTAAIGGAAAFVCLVSAHALVRHFKHTLELEPRVDTVEKVVTELRGDVSQFGDLSEKFKQLEDLSVQVAELQLRLSDGPGDENYPGNRGSSSGILQEVAGLEDEIKGIRADFEEANKDQHLRFNSELEVLQGLIKQVANQVSGHTGGGGIEEIDSNKSAEDTQLDIVDQPKELTSGDAIFERVETAFETTPEVPLIPDYADEAETVSDEIQLGEFSLQELEQTISEYDFGNDETDVVDLVRESIEGNRVELFLQPIVGLPDRNVRHYEALSRLRNSAGVLILPSHYIGVAENSGLMPLIDNIMLFRTVQVIRRLTEQDSTRGVFCNISPYSLVDPEFFPEFIEFMGENRQLSKYLVFELSQSAVRNAGKRELEGLASLAEYGFQFSLDQVSNLNIDFNALSARAFRFLKLDVRVFLHGMADAGARIHAADMAGYLDRYGLQLIIEKIEDDRSVASLVDYDVTLGQGFLFSEPRPVRPEVFDDAAMTAAA